MKRLLTTISLIIFLCSLVSAQTTRVVCDDNCKTESGATAIKGDGFAVVSPVGRGTVQMIEMAPRLSTLEGKTIAIVGGSFMARITHPELKRLFEKHYPTCRIILLDEIGSAGVYPAPGVTRRSLHERVFANYYANPGSNPEERHPIRNWRGHLTRTEGASMTPTPVWYDTPDSEMMTIPTMKEDMTAFIITGDSSRNKVQTMPGGGFETVCIELPRAWDKLMQEKGYKPIEEYYIK